MSKLVTMKDFITEIDNVLPGVIEVKSVFNCVNHYEVYDINDNLRMIITLIGDNVTVHSIHNNIRYTWVEERLNTFIKGKIIVR